LNGNCFTAQSLWDFYYQRLLFCRICCNAFIAGGKLGFKVFWKNNITPSLTVHLGTALADNSQDLEGAENEYLAHIRMLFIPLEHSKTDRVCRPL
jgi:hypothetical protein